MKGYELPQAPDGEPVVDLSAAVSKGPVREPANTDIVLCINRGNRVLQETFDGRHFEIPPGHFRIEYEAAKHAQRRQLVPGTKNESGGYVSFIGILGVNDDSACQPFTQEELARFGEAVEAIDRGAMSNPADRATKLVSTASARAASPTLGIGGRGGPGSRGIDTSAQANDTAADAAAHVLDAPAESDTRVAESEAASERGGRKRR